MKSLTQGNIFKKLLYYSMPIILANVLAKTHTVIDKAMVGQFVGELGLAAIGSTSSFVTVLSALFWSLGTGVSLFVAFNINKVEGRDVVRQIKAGTKLVLLVTIVFSLVCILFQKQIFEVLSIEGVIYNDAKYYYILMFIRCPFTAYSCLAKEVFFYLGKPSNAFKLSIISCIGNIILNYIFIKIFNMQVVGAGIATVLIIIIACICNIILLRKEIKKLSEEKCSSKISKHELLTLLKLTIPCVLQQGVLYLGAAIIQPTINRLGTSAIAAYSVTVDIYNVCTVFFYGSSKAVAVFCTQSTLKRKRLLIKGITMGLCQSLMLSSVVVVPILIFPEFTASIFVRNGASEVVAFIVRYVNLCFPFIVFAIVNNLFHNVFRGLMLPSVGLTTSTVFMLTQIITVLCLVPKYFMDGVYFGNIVAWIVEFLVCFAVFIFVLKRPNQTKQSV